MADYIVTYQTVQAKGNLPGVKEATIKEFFPEAKKDVIDIIGQEKYDELYAITPEYEPEDEDDWTYDDRLNVQAGEAYFVLTYLIPGIAKKSTGDGIIKATGFGDSRSETISETEVNQMIDRYRSTAVKLLKDYALVVDVDEDENPDQVILPGIKMGVIAAEE